MAREGDIAICNQKQIGLIQKVKGSAVSGMMHYGIHLSASKFGQPWQSKHPQVVGNIHDLLATLSPQTAESVH